MLFDLHSNYQPTGDQPQAIEALTRGVNEGKRHQVLKGITGSGKTFTMANIIKNVNRPTLVIAHNKTLAAQLAAEFREFFPNNAVGYFVSYYDYYQPEAYIPSPDPFIEKDSSVNDEIDRMRHSRGVFSDQLAPAYAFLDEGLGIMLDALEQTGLMDETIINITSDHGHCDIDHVTSINRFLALHGFVTYDSDGLKIVDYKAYCHTASLSAQIYIKDHDPVIREQVYRLLKENQAYLGISEILTVRECEERFHTNGNYDFMIESDGQASFSARANYTDVFTKCDISDYRTSVATHGHMPDKGVQPIFFLRNPFAKKRVVLPHGRIIDQAPTLARLLGFDMPCADGRPIPELTE